MKSHARLIRNTGIVGALLGLGFSYSPAIAQSSEENASQDDRVVIDILAQPQANEPPTDAEIAACKAEQEAAIVSQEIIVCGQFGSDPANWFSGSRSQWQRDYARETMNIDDPKAPDVAGAGIFRGPATVSGLCFIPPCPKDPALLIDVEALPDPPKGSDADLIAQGLAPQEMDEDGEAEERAARRALLGLPAAPEFEDASEPEVSADAVSDQDEPVGSQF